MLFTTKIDLLKYLFTILCFFLLFSNSAYGQQKTIKDLLLDVKEASYYDSALLFKKGFETIKEAKKLNNRNALAEVYIYFGNYNYYVANLIKAKEYYNKAELLSRSTTYNSINELAKLRITYVEKELSASDEQTEIIKSIFNKAKLNHDSVVYLEALNELGIIKESENNYNEAINYYLEGMHLADSIGFTNFQGVFRNNLGLIKHNSGKYTEAMKDFQDAYLFAQKCNNKRLASHSSINICLIYIQEKKFKEADVIFKRVLDYFKIQKNPLELASTYVNLGNANANQDNHAQALIYYDEAIVLLKKHSMNGPLLRAYGGKAESYLKLRMFEATEDCLKKMEELVAKQAPLDQQIIYLQIKYDLNFQKNNIKEAHQDYLLLTQLKDSLRLLNNDKIVNELFIKYNTKNKENDLAKEKVKNLELEKANQHERYLRLQLIGISISIFLILLAGIFVYYFNQKRKQQALLNKELIKAIDDERVRIARDLHDDVGPILSLIKSNLILSEQNPGGTNIETLKQQIDTAIQHTRTISKKLFPAILERVGLERAIADLLENIQNATGINCSFEFEPEMENFSLEFKTHVFRILSECTNNTIKHAQASAIRITMELNPKELVLKYKDNGKGMEQIKNYKDGIGLGSIIERVKIIKGTAYFGNKHKSGFALKIIIKKEHLA